MTTLERLKKDLSDPNIESKIEKIINRASNVLYDMILFAEYLEKKHSRGFVVYWCTAGISRFEVSNAKEYYEGPERDWNGPVHWHTNLASSYISQETV